MRQLVDKIAILIVAMLTFGTCFAAPGRAYEVTDTDRNFLAAVVNAVESRDARWIAAHAMLPMTVDAGAGRRLVHTEAEMAETVTALLTEERRSTIKTAARQALFKNWQGVMVGDGVLWFDEFQADGGGSRYLITAFGGFAFQPTEQRAVTETNAPSFKVHGRLSVYNGNPSCRIWIVGTKRILGVAESAPPEVSFMPERLRQILTTENLIFADFTVVPLTKDEAGVMRMVRVIAAENIVVADGQLRFIRRVPERIEQ